MTRQEIFNKLYSLIGNKYGVAGLMGNLIAESNLQSNNMQNCYEGVYNDNTYTQAIDNGSYSRERFRSDAIGYGLAQWTYGPRKANMYDYIKGRGKSIGDCEAQIDFLIKELSSDYGSTLRVLKSATSVKEASDYVLVHFESPADQSESVKQYRTNLGLGVYSECWTGVNTIVTIDLLAVAKEVIAGYYGNGQDRVNKLTEAGYNATDVQNKVNELLNVNTKSIDEVVKEVIAGKWGNGQDRYNRLVQAGYNASDIQTRVNNTLGVTNIIKYTVQYGDTLSKIANKYKTTVKALATKNNIQNPNLIFVGQVLSI